MNSAPKFELIREQNPRSGPWKFRAIVEKFVIFNKVPGEREGDQAKLVLFFYTDLRIE